MVFGPKLMVQFVLQVAGIHFREPIQHEVRPGSGWRTETSDKHDIPRKAKRL